MKLTTKILKKLIKEEISAIVEDERDRDFFRDQEMAATGMAPDPTPQGNTAEEKEKIKIQNAINSMEAALSYLENDPEHHAMIIKSIEDLKKKQAMS
jgi:hypothetical protein